MIQDVTDEGAASQDYAGVVGPHDAYFVRYIRVYDSDGKRKVACDSTARDGEVYTLYFRRSKTFRQNIQVTADWTHLESGGRTVYETYFTVQKLMGSRKRGRPSSRFKDQIGPRRAKHKKLESQSTPQGRMESTLVQSKTH